ncbi:unnamed protein product [Caenorhabditis bovis]|uniref:Uncharacterized protein n=1 Tax=Caenorhabditis bovis TaxID=2654633 RepID=A0A8S1F9Z7_9PELO|nr:unnamed protein product [Caenorhabditis bovis]
MMKYMCDREFGPPLISRVIDEDEAIHSLLNKEKLIGHTQTVNSLKWDKKGTFLASGSDDKNVIVWRANHQIKKIETAHAKNVNAVDFIPSEKCSVVSGSRDGSILKYDIENDSPPKRWQIDGGVNCIETNKYEPHYFWVGCEIDGVKECDVRTPEMNELIRYERARVKSIAICEEHSHLMGVGLSRTETEVYDRRNLKTPLLKLKSSECPETFYATHITFNETGTEIMTNLKGGSIYVYDLNENKKPKTLEAINALIRPPSEQKPLLDPKHPDYRRDVQWLDLFFKQNHILLGIAYFSEVIQSNCVDPQYRSYAYTSRAVLCTLTHRNGDQYEVIRDCVNALQEWNGNSLALATLAAALCRLDYYDLSKQCCDEFNRRFPNAPDIEKEKITKTLIVIKRMRRNAISFDLEFPPGVMDYKERYTGLFNYRNDNSEAHFFGSRQQYIVAGMEKGTLFVWDREKGGITEIFQPQRHVPSIVRPHPTSFLLATSGTIGDVHIWEPDFSDKYLDADEKRQIRKRKWTKGNENGFQVEERMKYVQDNLISPLAMKQIIEYMSLNEDSHFSISTDSESDNESFAE